MVGFIRDHALFDPEIEKTRRRLNHEIQHKDDMSRPLYEYTVSFFLQRLQSSIRPPEIQAASFEINPVIIQIILSSIQFAGLRHDDPIAHILNFLEICDTFKQDGVSEDAIKLRLFPFSLRDYAKNWLCSLPAGSITTWDDLVRKFSVKYYPSSKMVGFIRDLVLFDPEIEITLEGDDLPRPLYEYTISFLQRLESSIQPPEIQAASFEIDPGFIQIILSSIQFAGLSHDDPNTHILKFLDICGILKQDGVLEDAIRLRLFPFSLRDKAKIWLRSLPAGSITTWDDLVQKFSGEWFQ